MLFKFVAFFASLALVNAGLLAPAVTYSSAPSVSYSSYSSPAKTISYAAAPVLSAHTYAAPALAAHTYGAPALTAHTYAAPALTAHTTYSSPAIATHAIHAAPAVAYSSAPSVSHVYNSVAAPSALAYAPTQLTYSSPAIGSTHQSTIRSFDGTVSHHSKAVDTAFSSVRKSDTRISNNLYTPAIATKSLTYAAPAQALYTPTIATKSYAYAAPAPAVYATQAAHHTYAAPLVKQALSYSAAPVVAHVSFDGLGAQYAW